MIYSYSQLKGKIKVGDKVRAVEGKYNPCAELENDGSNEREITFVDHESFLIDGCYHSFVDNEEDCFLEIIETNQPTMTNEREEITWDTLKEGDYVEETYGERRKVLGRVNSVIFLSRNSIHSPNHWETTYHSGYHIEELKHANYTIVQPDKQPRKVTLAEIAEKFGEEVEVVE